MHCGHPERGQGFRSDESGVTSQEIPAERLWGKNPCGGPISKAVLRSLGCVLRNKVLSARA